MLASERPLWGLCLIGGKSSRMGADKSSLNYSGLPQWKQCEKLLKSVCDQVYWSCRQEQIESLGLPKDHCFIDQENDLGPISGLLIAFTSAEVDWFILACDFPYCEKEDIQQLYRAYREKRQSTAFLDSDSALPEPLFAIWERQTQLKMIQDYQVDKVTSPRRTLVEANCRRVLARKAALINVNSRACCI